MGWSSSFIAAISGQRPLLGFRLYAWQVLDPPEGYLFAGLQPLATSDAVGGGVPIILGVGTSGDEMDPYDVGRSSLGEWEILVAAEDWGDVSPIGPGELAALEAVDLTNTATRETIQLGIVHDVETVTPTVYRIRIRSALSILGSRYTTTAELLAVLGDQATTTKVDPAWTPGDATLPTADNTDFRSETGEEGMIKVTPADGNTAGTEPFYLRWSSLGSGGGPSWWFVLPTGLGALDTTAIELDAGLGHAVKEVLFVEDHPLRVALKMLASTGDGSNGPYDTLPASWGFGLPEWAFDAADTEYWAAQSSPATGSDKWQIWTDTQQANPGEWLITALASGGWWLTMRQGRITGRAVVPVADRPELADLEITDDDLIEWIEVSPYDSGSTVGAKQARAIGPTATGTLAEDITRLPAEQYADFDVALYAHANEAEWVDEIADRLGPWRLRQSERRTGRFAGLRLAQLAPGSVVRLTSPSSVGRLAPYDRRVALVTRVSVAWTEGIVEVTLLIQPGYAEAPGATVTRPQSGGTTKSRPQ